LIKGKFGKTHETTKLMEEALGPENTSSAGGAVGGSDAFALG